MSSPRLALNGFPVHLVEWGPLMKHSNAELCDLAGNMFHGACYATVLLAVWAALPLKPITASVAADEDLLQFCASLED
jgi:hypothetical protein